MKRAKPAMKKMAKTEDATAASNGRTKKSVVKKALNFVGEHPKAAAAALTAGVGAYALVHKARKGVKRGMRKVKNAMKGRKSRTA